MSSSGLRPSEAMQLTVNDIDLANRTIHVRNDAMHHTKTGKDRIAFFNEQTRIVLERYIRLNKNKLLWNTSSVARAWRHAPIKPKYCRKFFSQQWVRNNGNQMVKEILMGHSLNNSVDGAYYCAMSEQDLKKIYDAVMK
jgi:integrase